MPIAAEPETEQDHPRGVKPRMQYPRQPPPLFTYATLLWQSHYSLSPFQSRLSVQPPEAKQEACSVYTALGTALGRLLRRPASGSAPSFRGRTPVGDKPPRPEAAALRLACARLRFSRGIPRAPAAAPPLHAQVLRRRAAVWKGAPSRCTCACPKESSPRPRRSQASST